MAEKERAEFKSKWTLMIYLNADGDLHQVALDDLASMKQVGSNRNINLIAQLDSQRFGKPVRLRIRDEHTLLEEDLLEIKEVSGSSLKEELTDFIKWAIGEFPAEHYALLMWGHGKGWQLTHNSHYSIPHIASDGWGARPQRLVRAGLSVNNQIAIDEFSNAIGAALANAGGQKIDILAMDACLMGMIETGYQVRDIANFLVASEDSVPRDGWPYERIFSRLKAQPNMAPQELAMLSVREYLIRYSTYPKGVALSACNLKESGRLKQAITSLVTILRAKLNELQIRFAIMTARTLTQSFYLNEFIDLYDFCEKLSGLTTDLELKSGCGLVFDFRQRTREA